MNSLIFYRRVTQHELYCCQSSFARNFYQLTKLIRFTATITPRQHSLSRLVILLAVLQVILNKRATLKFISLGGAKKICAFSQLSKSSQVLALKDNLFNFTFFKQQRLSHLLFDNKCTFFLIFMHLCLAHLFNITVLFLTYHVYVSRCSLIYPTRQFKQVCIPAYYVYL